MTARVPPHDAAAERDVIGSALLAPECADEMVELLAPEEFYLAKHQLVWEALTALVRLGDAPDLIGLTGFLGKHLEEAGGHEYLLQLTDTIPSVAMATKRAVRIRQLATIRGIALRAAKVFAESMDPGDDLDEWIGRAEAALADTEDRPGQKSSMPFAEVIDRTFQELTEQAERGTHLVGVPTGLAELDRHTHGLSPGHLIVAAGRAGMGKTAFSLNVTTAAAQLSGGACLFFSLEMTAEQLGLRFLSSEGKVDGHVLRGGGRAADSGAKNGLTRDEWSRLTRAGGVGGDLPIRIWDQSATIHEIVSHSRKAARKLKRDGKKLSLIIVDYIQIVTTSRIAGRSREQEVSEITRLLKALAKELACPVLALSQLNRDLEKRPANQRRPMLSDLRESGAIEQDADVVLFVYRDHVYNPAAPENDAEIIIAKQRAGYLGTCHVGWQPAFTKFVDRERDRPDSDEYPTNYQDGAN